MGIFDRLRAKAHRPEQPGERAALAHDEAAEDMVRETEPPVERAGGGQETSEEERQAQSDMTAEGDPWD